MTNFKTGNNSNHHLPSLFRSMIHASLILVFSAFGFDVLSQAPTVNLPTVTSVTTTAATLGGKVTGTLTHRGTRWNTTSPVATSNELEEASVTPGDFTQARTGLPAASKIFFVAYARNAALAGTSSETIFFTEPTQLTGGQFTAASTSDLEITLSFPSADSWEGTNVTGGYAIFRKASSAPSLGALVDGVAPPADGAGDKIATITNGTFTSYIDNTGLSAETEYYYTIIPFVWDGAAAATYNYNITTPQTTSDFTFSTFPTNHPSNGTFTVSGVSSTQINLAFDAPGGLGNSDGYIILRRQDGTDPTIANIQDGVAPATLAGLLPAGTTLAGTSTTTSFNDIGLNQATQYNYLILPYNSDPTQTAGTYNYKTGGTPVTPKNDYTFSTEPGSHATGALTVTPISVSQINLAFNSVTTSSIANASGYIVLVKSSAIVAADLATLNDGAAPNAFGLFEAIINSTSTNSYNDITGLSPNTTYHYAIIPYKRGSDDETYNYLTSTGFPTGSATTPDISATVVAINGGTAPVIAGTTLSAGSTLQVLTGFSITSDGTQTLTDIGFNYAGLAGQFADEYLYRSTSAGAVGTQLLSDSSPDGNFNMASVAAGDKAINATTVYYYLVVDVDGSNTQSTASVTTNPTQANIVTSSGTVNAFSISRTFGFNTSQLSDIILVPGGTTNSINYRTFVANSINDDQSNSVTLADYSIRDGGATNDSDDKGMSITSIQIQVTNAQNLRQIALFDDNANTEIAGTEQAVSGSGTVTITFTPTTPITVGDNSSFDINVRGVFKSTVTDKQSLQISIVSATAPSTVLSGFSPIGSWASTQTASNTNVIAVNASKLVFVANPPATAINTNFPLSVKAVDGNPYNNLDLDYIGKVDLTATGGGGTLSGGAQSLSPNLVAGQFDWTQLKITQASTYTLDASDDNYTGQANNPTDIGDASGSVVISSSASNITKPADALLCYGGPTSSKALGNIVITETDPSGITGGGTIPGSYTFSLVLPSGFIFDQSQTTGLAVSGGSDLTAPSTYTYPGNNVVEFSFTINGTANTNAITIGGLKILAPHPGTASPLGIGPLSVTRLGGTVNIAGVNAGTELAKVSASPSNPGTDFTVAALSGDVTIDPNTTEFNVNSAAVNLVGTTTPGVFSGSGVTFSNPNYRFNPNSLAPGNYDITYTQTTSADGCQSVAINSFNVFVSGINGLDPSYCTNDPVSPTLTVSQTFINQRFGGTDWRFDNFVYYDPISFSFTKITTPNNAVFDPSLPAYQSIVQYFGGQIPVGFAVCSVNALDGVPCNGNSTFGVYSTYQWVTINPAPSVSFTLPSDVYIYCEDNAPIKLTGSPDNSNNFAVDKFDATLGQSSSVTHSLVSGKEEWVFSPAAVSGVTPSTSKTFDITYQYEEPSTGCRSTVSKSITVHDRPTVVPSGDITKSTSNPPSPSTTMQLCEGSGVGSFSATDATYTYRWYANTVSAGNFKGTGATFTPPINNLSAGLNTFQVTRTRNDCESTNTPLALTVDVIATPVPPATDRNLSYCVGTSIPNNDLQITTATGTVKWYLAGNPTPVFTGSNPTAANLGIVTTTANIYNFELTQVGASGCEGPLLANRTKISVKIKPLPNISIAPSAAGITKICTTGGIISFKATDNGTTAPSGTWSGPGLGGVGVLNPFNALGITELNPSTLSPQTYTLRYDYTDATTLCSNFKTIDFTILPTITPVITIGNVCDGSPAVIVNNSQVNQSSSTNSKILYAEWTLGDGSLIAAGLSTDPIPANTNTGRTSGTYLSPTHIYPNVGTFQITGSMTTSDGCRYTFPVPPANIPVTVSPLPKINFTWKNVCRDKLTSTEFIADETSTPKLPLTTYTWNFKTEGSLTTAAEGSGANPIVKYTNDGSDSVKLIVATSSGCRDTVTKIVYVVPRFRRIETDSSYLQSFDGGPDSWLTGGVKSSWALDTLEGKKNGFVFDGDAGTGKGMAWDTNPKGASNKEEKSWVMSQCFNFTKALKPVISLDIWSDTPQGVEGAVLQYNVDGKIEDETSWKVLGEVDKGINWYDAQGIASSPGDQASGDVGWTGNAVSSGSKYSSWSTANYKLDELIGKDNVVFRIAFGGGPGRTDGFAFDNVFIGERSRIVLLENFTNSSATVANHNNLYKNSGTDAELVKIQYHTAFPGADPLHDLNPQMNNARTAFYGVTQAPTMRIDGDYQSGPLLSWLPSLYEDRVLKPAGIKIKILTSKQANGEVLVDINLENISGATMPLKDAHIFTAIVEKSITSSSLLGNSGNNEFVYVAREFLPSPSGKKITSDLLPGKTYKESVTWTNRSSADSLAIVVFVQNINGNNKNVFQAQIDRKPIQPDVVTSIKDLLPEQVNVYPNPASSEFKVELPSIVQNEVKLHLIDMTGRKYEKGMIPSGGNSATVNVEDLSEGIYILEIGAGNTGIIRKKIMVVMKN